MYEMVNRLRKVLLLVMCALMCMHSYAQYKNVGEEQSSLYKNLTYSQLVNAFNKPNEDAKPWVFWYWMYGAVTAEAVTADLQAMKQAGIAGAYLMPIKDTTSPSLVTPAVRQLSPEWWKMLKYTFKEADRLGVKLAMHVSDGFALAGGPWITPELSMQKVVWTRTRVSGGVTFNDTLAQPETRARYYKDIAVYAFPTPVAATENTSTIVPTITTSKGTDAQFLVAEGNKQNFSSDDTCWIQYAFDKPFTCRSIVIKTNGNNYQAHRLLIEVSDDGIHFRSIGRLKPPRHGWQDTDADVTHSISATTAKYFRFVYNKEGSEPGAEDLDAAKWKPALKVKSIMLSGAATVNQYEGKNGSVWRVSERTTEDVVPDSTCVPLSKIINITQYFSNGRLKWKVPDGNWTIMRFGHTSTGQTNATGGGGKGLECDKFNEAAITKQFNGWFGEAIKHVGPELAAKVLKVFHIDSWECGSQNWSDVFADEFKKRRGYDIFTYLPVMAGVPVESADTSERFLHDVRKTIAELVVDKFYVTMARLAKEKGCTFSAESIAPTMLSDGMMHYQTVDIPMGEFWLNSPTHDKPNDMMDAISGAHIYGKPVVQAEAFTTLRMDWTEHPAMLKALQDRNYALGINKLVFHVFTHNPWMDKKPGMTLDPIGLYFQRDQTWWKQSKAWMDYTTRCQAMLQVGKPVIDVAVFTGEELPRRSILPDRLVSTLPGIFGKDIVEREAKRLANKGEPLRELPAGVRHAANMTDPAAWIDPLHGYAYDSFNPDALLTAKTVDGRVVMQGGASYKLLVLPQPHPMSPSNDYMSAKVAQKLNELVKDGASIVVNDVPLKSIGLHNVVANDRLVEEYATQLWTGDIKGLAKFGGDTIAVTKFGAGKVVKGPYNANSFEAFGLLPDVITKDENGMQAVDVAWTHRASPGLDIYFFANQKNIERTIEVSLRVPARVPELWDPVTGIIQTAKAYKTENFRTILPIRLAPNGSVFIVLSKPASLNENKAGTNSPEVKTNKSITSAWQVRFDDKLGGPARVVLFNQLQDWSKHTDTAIKYYSGTAVYSNTFTWPTKTKGGVQIDLGNVANIATVKVNGVSCGTAWTSPYRVDITKAIKPGTNKVEIEVANTWLNRLIGDSRRPPAQRITYTYYPFKFEGRQLVPAGLLGPVSILQYK